MTGTAYSAELDKLAMTYRAALAVDVERFKAAVAGASGSSIIGVGSGGSFTVASLLCSLHEAYTGRVSRPSSPLEIICNPTLAAASPVFLISAEGKNPDIIEALRRARMHSARSVHILTNKADSGLLTAAQDFSDITTHLFELASKDGFLATNSLLFDAIVVARAYEELDDESEHFPASIDALTKEAAADFVDQAAVMDFAREAASRGSVLVTFSPQLRPVAADLESKLAEAALIHCQLADLRSFAHGRHTWLAERAHDCVVLALIEPYLRPLWQQMLSHIVGKVPTLTMTFASSKPRDLIAGLVKMMRLVDLVSEGVGKDPAQPPIEQFGRSLYYLDLRNAVPPPPSVPDHGELSKYEVLGAHWPLIKKRVSVRRAREAFRRDIVAQRFRAVVFDYDGTLSSSQRNESPPHDEVVKQLKRLLDSKIIVGIASGRGGSIQQHLRTCLPQEMWNGIYLGLYNGGLLTDAAQDIPEPKETKEFLSHVTRIVHQLKDLGVPIEQIRPNHPNQLSVRFQSGVQSEGMWFVIADALRQAGLDPLRIVKSKHSVDILAEGVNKSHLVAHIIQREKIDPYQVLTMGDQGAWPGNDASLLEHRFSLSVDVPSRRLDRGWNLAPSFKRDVDAALWYLEHAQHHGDGTFSVQLPSALD